MTNKQLDKAIELVEALQKDPYDGELIVQLTELNKHIKQGKMK